MLWNRDFICALIFSFDLIFLFFVVVLGDFVRLDGVHLWDNVKVDDGCKISKSILCHNVHIKR